MEDERVLCGFTRLWNLGQSHYQQWYRRVYMAEVLVMLRLCLVHLNYVKIDPNVLTNQEPRKRPSAKAQPLSLASIFPCILFYSPALCSMRLIPWRWDNAEQ